MSLSVRVFALVLVTAVLAASSGPLVMAWDYPIGGGIARDLNMGNDTTGGLPSTDLPPPDDHRSDGNKESQASGSYHEMYLYFHRGGQGTGDLINTVPPSNHEASVLASGQGIEFVLEVPLTKNLEVFSHETQGGSRGFWLDLNVIAVTATLVTIQVTDNTTIIAQTTETISAPMDRWYLPYTPAATSHVFLQGQKINLKINVTSAQPLGGGITINYRQNDKLWVPCNPTDLSAGTYDGNGKARDDFLPNWPERLRKVVVKGKIDDAFGAGDVGSIGINITDPTSAIAFQSSAAGGSLNFSFEWAYNAGLRSGTYNVVVTVFDNQQNNYTTTDTFTMKDYGVYIESTHQDEPEGMAEQNVMSGSTATYIVTVLNCGGLSSPFSVTQETSDKSGWDVNIDPTTTQVLAPNEVATVQIDITPSVPAGEYATIWFEFKSDNDGLALERLQTFTGVTPAFDLKIQWVGLTSKTADAMVGVGGSKSFEFTVSNGGQNPVNFSLSLSDPPSGWGASVDGVMLNTVLRLDPGTSKTGTLNITAPDDQTATNESLMVITLRSVGLETEIEDTITARVTMSTGLDLSSSSLKKTADPGQSPEFTMTVKNGDPMNSHEIVFEVQNPGDLSINVMGGLRQRFSAREIKNIQVQARVPDKATAGDHAFTVKGAFGDNSLIYDMLSFTVTVNKKPKMDMTVTPKSMKIKTTEMATFKVTFVNSGNVLEQRVLDISTGGDVKASAVTVSLNGKVGDNLDFTIKPGETVDIEVQVDVSNDVKNGDQAIITISLIEKSGYASVEPVKVTIDITKEAGLMDMFMDGYFIGIMLCFFIIVVVFFKLRR